MTGVAHVLHLTSDGGFGAEGGLPVAYRHLLNNFRFVRMSLPLDQRQWRCPRAGFVPFHIHTGKLLKTARDDGIPTPSASRPIFLISVISLVGGVRRMLGLGLAHLHGERTVRLEYLCAAPAAKGVGKRILDVARTRSTYAPYVVDTIVLEDDSNIPGYYAHRGFVATGETRHLPGWAASDIAGPARPDRDAPIYTNAVRLATGASRSVVRDVVSKSNRRSSRRSPPSGSPPARPRSRTPARASAVVGTKRTRSEWRSGALRRLSSRKFS